jgi:predicted nucleic acid-binding protein
MSSVAVDTSVLLEIFKGEPRGELWLETLQSAAEAASLLLSSVVLAEVRLFFPSDDACRKALRDLDLKHSPLTEEASLLAGKIFRTYRSERGPTNDNYAGLSGGRTRRDSSRLAGDGGSRLFAPLFSQHPIAFSIDAELIYGSLTS